ncbi:hypothetical protein Scep_014885 [Stephania cephalantha]|uniref:Tf2-1-like SH3-like domain-containing protein n=1 Tax=Stephania cephalantha TaxID=152367 RepID=A0AAP0P0W6_9MAGN
MLRACINDFQNGWSKYLHSIDFAYNNSYQTSIRMTLYDALYGRPCRSPTCWLDKEDKVLLGPEIIAETNNKIQIIQNRLKIAQSCQKTCADSGRKSSKLQVDELVLLKLSPMKGIQRFGKKEKFAPRFICPFSVAERIGETTYRIDHPLAPEKIHDVFHVSMLKKYKPDSSHIIQWNDLYLEPNSSYQEQPTRILNNKIQQLRNRQMEFVKVLWQHHSTEEATWELKSEMQKSYPHLLI